MTTYVVVRQGAWRTLSVIAGSLVALASTHTAFAQAWPTKNITTIVPFAAGSASDVIPRVVLDQVSKQVGRAIVVENRGGAGGTTRRQRGRKVCAGRLHDLGDGRPWRPRIVSIRRLPYDTLRDFVPVIPLGQQPLVLVTAPSKGFKTLGRPDCRRQSEARRTEFCLRGNWLCVALCGRTSAHQCRIRGPAHTFQGRYGRIDGNHGGASGLLLCPARAGACAHQGRSGSSRSRSVRPSGPPRCRRCRQRRKPDFLARRTSFGSACSLPAKTPRDIVVQASQGNRQGAASCAPCRSDWRSSASSRCR